MLIWSMCSVLGLWIAHRTLNDCENLRLFSEKKMMNLRLFIFLTVLVMNFLFRNHFLMLSLLSVFIFSSPFYLPKIIEFQREKQLKEQFVVIIDQIILSMKSGKSFRSAFLICLERQKKPVQYVLSEFMSALQYQKEIESMSKDRKIVFYFQELAQVDHSTHKPIDRLKALRRRLLIERNFRQKSRQALLQIRFQSWIITGMYLMVLLYVRFEFGMSGHLILILGSTFLFLIGLVCVQRMGRNYRWKT